jgi:hypothetical protein
MVYEKCPIYHRESRYLCGDGILSHSRPEGFRDSEAPARITKRVMQYAPLKPIECIPAEILMVDYE